MISAKTAFIAYIALAVLACATLDGEMRKYSLAALALFAVKTYVDIIRRRIADREQAESTAAGAAATPPGDVRPGGES
jgi:hypothetical protein